MLILIMLRNKYAFIFDYFIISDIFSVKSVDHALAGEFNECIYFCESSILYTVWKNSAAGPSTSILGDKHVGSEEMTQENGVVCRETGRRSDVTRCQMFTGKLT